VADGQKSHWDTVGSREGDGERVKGLSEGNKGDVEGVTRKLEEVGEGEREEDGSWEELGVGVRKEGVELEELEWEVEEAGERVKPSMLGLCEKVEYTEALRVKFAEGLDVGREVEDVEVLRVTSGLGVGLKTH